MHRVAAIGLDAAEWTLLEPWLADGTLPNLARLLEQGTKARLGNVREFRSEAIWSQFASGLDAGSTGHWTNVAFRPGTYEVADVGPGHLPPFWEGVGSSVIFDVPHTRLSDDRGDVTHVTGWGAHSSLYPRASSPAGLLREIDERFGPHPAFDRDHNSCWWDRDYLEALADACCVGAARRLEIVEWLLERQPDWRLVVTVMSEPHSIGHHTWHAVDPEHPLAGSPEAEWARAALRRVYQAVDIAVGRFADALPDDVTLVVFSLHGMQANTNDLPSHVLLPELLQRLGTGEALFELPGQQRWRQQGTPVVRPSMTWGDDVALGFADSPAARLRRALFTRLPRPITRLAVTAIGRLRGRGAPSQRFGDLAIPPEAEGRHEGDWDDLAFHPPSWYRRHWPTLPAFALPTFSDGHVRVNLAGREANGVIPLERYDAYLDELAAELRRCTDVRTGRPVVEDIVFPRRHDPLDESAPPPDLVVFWHPGVDAIEHPEAGMIGPLPPMRTGEHSSRGFVVVAGPDVEPTDLGQRSALDVAPTLVSLLSGDGHELSGRPLVGRAG